MYRGRTKGLRLTARMAIVPGRRTRLAAFLTGRGVELGPGHVPFPAPPDVQVTFVDRWRPDESVARFPELTAPTFPEPGIIANFDTDRLKPLADTSQDFVICSHVLEHLAEPIGFVAEVYRVLRPGGVALIMLPDRRRTFDRSREPTTLKHLVGEYRAGVTEVDDAHLCDFLVNSALGQGEDVPDIPQDEEERRTFFEWHRERSVHVHCWTDEEFLPVVLFGIRRLGQRWMLLDRIRPEDDGIEFGFVMKRRGEWRPRRRLARQFREAWERF